LLDLISAIITSIFNEEVQTHGRVRGVQIVGASEESPGWRANLRPGDVIIAANHVATPDLDHLQKVAATADKQLLLHVLHGTGALYVVVK
jgi:serine protease Do